MERREYDVVLVPEAQGGFSVFVPDLAPQTAGISATSCASCC